MLIAFAAFTLLSAQEREAAAGRQLADSILARSAVVTSPEIERYLERLTARVQAAIPQLTSPLNIRVIADGACRNLEALPGGYVFVPALVLLEAQNEAGFEAEVLRAAAHLALKHGVRTSPDGMRIIYSGGCEEAIPLGWREQRKKDEIEAAAFSVEARKAMPPSDASGFAAAQAEVRRTMAAPSRKPPTLRRKSETATVPPQPLRR